MEGVFIVKGGKPLRGKVNLSGAKNVALKIIIASLMLDGEVIIRNIPRIGDVCELVQLINNLGGKAEFIEKNVLRISGKNINKNRIDFFHGSKIRVSFMLAAPLLYKFKKSFIPNPGGCRIGSRPIDRIVEGMRSLGIKVDYDSSTGYYRAILKNKPSGFYRFAKSSHTGTEFLILLSVFGKDKIVIENAALEPEVDELIRFLNESGAKIYRNKTTIEVYGVSKLKQKKDFFVIADRNEAVTYASLAIASRGEITLGKIPFYLIERFVKELKKAGGGFERLTNQFYRFYYQKELTASKIETSPYPGFMTDWQPLWAVLMLKASGKSVIVERVFEDRFSYVAELNKLGAKIRFVDLLVKNPQDYYFFNYNPEKKYHQAIEIFGPQTLHNGVLNITDLRAGATLAVAALTVDGESVINGASILERGYEDFVEKVSNLGGQIKKI